MILSIRLNESVVLGRSVLRLLETPDAGERLTVDIYQGGGRDVAGYVHPQHDRFVHFTAPLTPGDRIRVSIHNPATHITKLRFYICGDDEIVQENPW